MVKIKKLAKSRLELEGMTRMSGRQSKLLDRDVNIMGWKGDLNHFELIRQLLMASSRRIEAEYQWG